MRREKQHYTVAALKAVELLRNEGACVHDVAYSSDRYNSSSSAYHQFISILPVQLVGARGRDAHSSVSRSIHTHPDPAHTSDGGRDRFASIPTLQTHQLGGRDMQRGRDRERSRFASVCLLNENRHGQSCTVSCNEREQSRYSW